MNADEIIKRKKVDMNILNSCVGKDGYITYNAFFISKKKRQLTKEEYLLLKGYVR